jgi:ABC-type multidrug transport system fused ATPase/permease subunit
MKFKFIHLVFFTSLLFLFVNGRDANKKTTENYHNNDYEVHFVVHKTKNLKKENFLERKKKRIQKKVNRLVEKYDKVEISKTGKWVLVILSTLLLLFLVSYFVGIEILLFIFSILIGAQYTAGSSAGGGAGGALLFLLLVLIIFYIIKNSNKKKQKQKD